MSRQRLPEIASLPGVIAIESTPNHRMTDIIGRAHIAGNTVVVVSANGTCGPGASREIIEGDALPSPPLSRSADRHLERPQRHATFDHSFDDLEDGARLRRLETSFEEVSSLSKAETNRERFLERLLHLASDAVGARGGAIWELDERGQLQPAKSLALESFADLLRDEAESEHTRLVAGSFETNRGRIFSPRGSSESGAASNPTEFTLLLQPILQLERVVAVLELVLSPDLEPREQRAAVEVTESLADLASEFFLRDALRRDKRNAQVLGEFDLFLRHLHQVPKLAETAQSIVNQGRRFLECDRVSLVLCQHGGCRLQAVTGVESVNRRANAVRTLEDLVESVLAQGQPFVSYDQSTDTSRNDNRLLDAYLEVCPVRQTVIVPLPAHAEYGPQPASEPIGTLVIESFHDPLPSTLRPRVELIREHSGSALRNALDNGGSAIPRWLKASRLSKGGALLAFASLVTAALVLIPADFSIEAKGRLQPLERREIFAPSAGIVRGIHVAHSQKVKPNDVLVKLENPALELEYERVRGELQTVRERVLALEATRGTQTARDAKDTTPGLIVAQTEELKERLANLESQKKLIETQRESLVLKSPLDGEVITWKPEDVLKDRPVERGQRLVTIAAPQGPWVLELLIPDQSIGHVLDAQNQLGSDLPVTYILATDPSRTYASHLRSVASSAETYEDHQPYVLATVDLKSDEIPARRPGATVVAKVHCGKRSLGYVWLRELFETIQRHVML